LAYFLVKFFKIYPDIYQILPKNMPKSENKKDGRKALAKKLFLQELHKICKIGLLEDDSHNDITSDLTIKNNSEISFKITAREELILCGVDVINFCFDELIKFPKFKKSSLALQINAKNGDLIKPQGLIAQGFGDAKLIFAAERIILNLLQHLSGISTLTNKFVKTLNNKKIKILDTRKTFPGARTLQKYAVATGGGSNHRFNLSDAILIKDNHIAAAGSVTKALELAKKFKKLKIEIECDNLKQVSEAVKQKPHIIMLDNMKISDIQKAIKLINKKSQIEISGGITLESIKKFSKLDVDFISIGALTHSVKAVDIGLDVE
jgi:nicotinate-nucleotide pyrophosphorylase (carboxylating)